MRNSDKTLKMVQSLPESGAIILVHAGPLCDYLKRMIADVHGSLDNFKIFVVTDNWSLYRLRGQRLPIYCDHTLWDDLPDSMRNELQSIRNFKR